MSRRDPIRSHATEPIPPVGGAMRPIHVLAFGAAFTAAYSVIVVCVIVRVWRNGSWR